MRTKVLACGLTYCKNWVNYKAGGTQLVAMHYGPSYVKLHLCGRKGTRAGCTAGFNLIYNSWGGTELIKHDWTVSLRVSISQAAMIKLEQTIIRRLIGSSAFDF